MPYKPPSLSELVAQCQTDFTDVPTRLTEALSSETAAQAYGLYAKIKWVSNQILPTFADEDMLLRHCAYRGVWRKLASCARGVLTFQVSGLAMIDKGVRLQNRRGVIVEVTESAIIQSGAAPVTVKTVDAGASANCAAGEVFELISPIANVQNEAQVSSAGLTGGADIESLDALLSRLVYRVQYPPSGGTKYDYVRWALECAGITRAWCIPAPQYKNYVTVLVVMDDNATILPSQADLKRVEEYINGHINPVTNQWEGKPPAAETIVKAPTLKKVNPVIQIIPDKPEIRRDIEQALQALFYNQNIGEKLYLSKFRAAISDVKNVIDSKVINLSDDITTVYDEIAVLGEIKWQ